MTDKKPEKLTISCAFDGTLATWIGGESANRIYKHHPDMSVEDIVRLYESDGYVYETIETVHTQSMLILNGSGNKVQPDFDWHEPDGWVELVIENIHGEISIEISNVKWGAEWWNRWVINDNYDTYDSGFQFSSHGEALDDALLFWQEYGLSSIYDDIENIEVIKDE